MIIRCSCQGCIYSFKIRLHPPPLLFIKKNYFSHFWVFYLIIDKGSNLPVVYLQSSGMELNKVYFPKLLFYKDPEIIMSLKGVFAKNERGYRLNAIKKRFWSLLIFLLYVASIWRKLLKTSYTEERSVRTNWERCNILLRP